MNITIALQKKGFIGYKSGSFPKWNSKIYKSTTTNDQDWSGLYIAQNEEVAKGYLPDMASNGTGTAYIHKVYLKKDIHLITCLDSSFKTGDIDMDALKQALRDKGIEVSNHELLIPSLGELGYFFSCYNNEDGDIEVIVPNCLAEYITMEQFKSCVLKNYEIQSCDITVS